MNGYQTLVWTNRAGEEIPVDSMDLPYLRNVIAFLERRAPQLEVDYTNRELIALARPIPIVIGEFGGRPVIAPQYTDLMPKGEMAQAAFEEELALRARNPIAWLHTLPLVRAMDERIAALEAG